MAKALALDDRLGEAHGVAALLRVLIDFDWAGAEKEFLLALELSPGSADIHDHYGWLCSALERWDDALRHVKEAGSSTPCPTPAISRRRSCVRAVSTEALEAAERVIAFEPTLARGHSVLGWARLASGRPTRVWRPSNGRSRSLPRARCSSASSGRPTRSRARRIGRGRSLRRLEELGRATLRLPLSLRLRVRGAREEEHAMDWLERAYDERSGAIYGIKGSFLFASLKAHPRFAALLQKMNLPL